MSWEADFNDARNESTRLRAQLAAAEREHGAASAALSEAVATNEHLRAQLAAVEKERDRLAHGLTVEKGWSEAFREDAAKLLADNDALAARVKALEAALEPSRSALIGLLEELEWPEGLYEEDAIDLLRAIRARAGLTKEGT